MHRPGVILAALAVVLLHLGCSQSTAHSVTGILLNGDAETGGLSQWNYIEPQCRLGTRRQAVRVVTSPVRQGRYAYRFRATNGDLDPWGHESCEITKGRDSYGLGEDEYYGLSFRFQSPWHAPYRWGLIAQFAYPDLTSPPFAINARGRVVKLNIDTGRVQSAPCAGPPAGYCRAAYSNWPGAVIIRPLLADTWYDLVIHVRWATTWTGLLEVWRRVGGKTGFTNVLRRSGIPTQQWGASQVDIKGVEADGRPKRTEDKIGIYREHDPFGQADNVVHHDGFRIAHSWSAIMAGFRGSQRAGH